MPPMMLPGMAKPAVCLPPANIATKNSAPNPITMKGQRNPQSKARKNCPARDSNPTAISTAPPTSAPALERFVCIFFSFQILDELSHGLAPNPIDSRGSNPPYEDLLILTQQRR